MRAMRVPAVFISLYSLLITGATTRVKINGYIGCPITLRNGVRQGCPIAPLVYLITVQPFLSMLRLSLRPVGVRAPLICDPNNVCHLRGINIPSADGVGLTCEVTPLQWLMTLRLLFVTGCSWRPLSA